jgi:hypothetical protein
MATTLTVTGNSRVSYSLTESPVIGSVSESAELRTTRAIENGTGENQANVAWRNRVTIPAGQAYSLDLTNLGATVFGFAGRVTMTKLKEVMVVNNTATAGRYALWGVISPSDTTSYVAYLGRGGEYRTADYADGRTITAGVNNIVYVANPSPGAVELDMLLVGVGTYSDT